MAQHILHKALEKYLHNSLFDLSPIEVHVIQTEMTKLDKILTARIRETDAGNGYREV